MKLALISFDGLDPRVIYNNEDDLPTFHSFMDNAVHGKWRTPGHTIPSYIATLTGLSYHKTNFYWDVEVGGYARHRQLNRDYLWEIVDASMTLLNIPVLYPPEEIKDCMICGMLAPDSVTDSNIARPMEVQNMLNDIDYIHEIRADKIFDEVGAEKMYELLLESMWKRVEATELLIDKYDSELFYGVWTAPDRWFHRHHTYNVDYYPMYKEADEIFEKLLKIIPDNIPLIVFSDHGFAHFDGDVPSDTGHMYKGWYAFRHSNLPSYRDDSGNLLDLYPTVVNYLNGNIPEYVKGRILFHQDEQNDELISRLKDLGYMDE